MCTPQTVRGVGSCVPRVCEWVCGALAHPDESTIERQLLQSCVVVASQTLLHCSKIHGLLDDARVLMQAHFLPVDRLGKVHGLGALHDALHHGITLSEQRLIHRVVDKPSLGALVTVLRSANRGSECLCIGGWRCVAVL